MELTSIADQSLTAESSTAVYELGDYHFDPDTGNKYVYSQATAAIVKNSLVAIDPDVLTVSAFIVGAGTPTQTTNKGQVYSYLQVLDKTSGFGASNDLYKGYYGVMDVTGETFEIEGTTANQAFLKSALSNVTPTSLTAFHPHKVFTTPSGIESNVVGVARIAVTADYYFWRQTTGIAVILVDASSNIDGFPVINGGGGKCRAIRAGVDRNFVIGQVILGSKLSSGTAWVRLTGIE